MRGFLLILLALAAGFAGSYLAPAKTADVAAKETAFERVSRDRVLRCGYMYRAGYFEKDQTSGQMKGLMHDASMAIADAAGLKIEWSAEIGLGDSLEALRTGRVDAICGAFGENAKRAWGSIVAEPVGYVQMRAYVRADDVRFDNNIAAMNDASVRFNVVDGESSQFVTKAEFPNATLVSVPQLVEHSELFVGIAQNKADAILSDPAQAGPFMKNSPGKIREVVARQPVRSFPFGVAVANTEHELANLIGAATREVILSGKMEKVMQANETYPNTWGRNLLVR
ncbi:MAG: substrate-binding periplasmic protein [Bdellovibrionales bacterium]